MSTCTDNPRLGLLGCGATYNGKQCHSVARVDWSVHPDGRAHLTFSNDGAHQLCWRGDVMYHPINVRDKEDRVKLEQSEKGVWHRAGNRPDHLRGTSGTDELAEDGAS